MHKKKLKRGPEGVSTEWADWMQRRKKSLVKLKQKEMELRTQKLEHKMELEDDY